MNKWEYYTFVKANKVINLPEILEPLGLEGWELVSYSNLATATGLQTVLIFKRSLEEASNE